MASPAPQPPAEGAKITISQGKLNVPDQPIIPFIEGDGTGPDIWRASVRVLDAAVEKAYGGKRKIAWMEVYAGEKSYKQFNTWLPDETVDAFREYLVGIKGPLTTPVGGGIRSLNVALRQLLDLYVCLRPVRWFKGVPSPVKQPEKVDMVIFRENTEDIYAGIEFEAGTDDVQEGRRASSRTTSPSMYQKIRFPETAAIGIKPISREGTERLVRSAIEYAIANKRKSVTLVHKGNIMKFTEGAFRNWGYALAEREFADQTYTWEPVGADQGPEGRGRGQRRAEGRPGRGQGPDQGRHRRHHPPAGPDPARPSSTSSPRPTSTATISPTPWRPRWAASASPRAAISTTSTGHAVFEATHGTAPKYANLDQVNPGSVILSGEMMLRYMGWTEAADLIIKGMDGAIGDKTVTYDFARLMEGAKEVKCSEFGDRGDQQHVELPSPASHSGAGMRGMRRESLT